MSMLLEALKKSEEQRQLGSTPDIHRTADHRPGGSRNLSAMWVPLTLLVTAFIVMAWFGWQQFRAPEGLVSQPVAESRESSGPEQAKEPGSATPVTSQAETRRTPRTMVEQYSQQAGQKVKAGQQSGQQADKTRQDVSRSFNQFAAQEGESDNARKPSGADAAQPATSPGEAGRPAPPPIEMQQEDIASARPEPATSKPYEARPMSYWELPQSVRDSLPEFRITVSVFADDPEDRFLLINGMRMKEGEELASGVVLDEIRRDGAVFRARNYRFLVRGG